MTDGAKSGWAAYTGARESLARGELKPFYLLFGPSACLKAEFLAALRARVGAGDDLNYNHVPEDAPAPAAAAVMQARTPAFLGNGRLVVFSAGHLFGPPDGMASARTASAKTASAKTASAKTASAEAEEQALADYLAQPPEFSCLVALCPEVDKRRRSYRAAAAAGAAIVPCEGPTGEALYRWLRARAREHGKDLDLSAAALLAGKMGDDLDALAQELAKLAAYAGEQPAIAAADIAAATPGRPAERVFVLLDDLGDRRPDRALAHLASLLRQGEHPLRVIALIANHLRTLCRARALLDRGLPPARAEQELRGGGVHPYVVSRAVRQAGRFGARELEDLVVQLHLTDAAIKKGQLRDAPALELFLLGAGQGSRPRRAWDRPPAEAAGTS